MTTANRLLNVITVRSKYDKPHEPWPVCHILYLSAKIFLNIRNLQLESFFPNVENNGGLKHQKYLKFNNLARLLKMLDPSFVSSYDSAITCSAIPETNHICSTTEEGGQCRS